MQQVLICSCCVTQIMGVKGFERSSFNDSIKFIIKDLHWNLKAGVKFYQLTQTSREKWTVDHLHRHFSSTSTEFCALLTSRHTNKAVAALLKYQSACMNILRESGKHTEIWREMSNSYGCYYVIISLYLNCLIKGNHSITDVYRADIITLINILHTVHIHPPPCRMIGHPQVQKCQLVFSHWSCKAKDLWIYKLGLFYSSSEFWSHIPS